MDLAACRIRASPAYRLSPRRESTEPGRPRHPSLAGAGEWEGTVSPVLSDFRRPQSISRDTAALLERCRTPIPVPGDLPAAALARLVLDGLVEIECRGLYHSGPTALPLCQGEWRRPPVKGLAALAVDALHYGERLALRDGPLLADRLYRYNTAPASAARRRLMPDRASVRRWLGGSRSTAIVHGAVDGGSWIRIEADPDAEGGPGPMSSRSFKLYLSPTFDGVPRTWRSVLDLFGTPVQPLEAKVGADLAGILRPDKMVAYFPTRDRLCAAAEILGAELAGVEAQGVPFTAPLGDSLLLSWGTDPGQGRTGAARSESWRHWVTHRLASFLCMAEAAGAPVTPAEYALRRIDLDGISPETWMPPSWLDESEPSDADH